MPKLSQQVSRVSTPRAESSTLTDVLEQVKYHYNNQPFQLAEVAQKLRVANGTLSKALQILESEGMIKRVRDGSVKYGPSIFIALDNPVPLPNQMDADELRRKITDFAQRHETFYAADLHKGLRIHINLAVKAVNEAVKDGLLEPVGTRGRFRLKARSYFKPDVTRQEVVEIVRRYALEHPEFHLQEVKALLPKERQALIYGALQQAGLKGYVKKAEGLGEYVALNPQQEPYSNKRTCETCGKVIGRRGFDKHLNTHKAPETLVATKTATDTTPEAKTPQTGSGEVTDDNFGVKLQVYAMKYVWETGMHREALGDFVEWYKEQHNE